MTLEHSTRARWIRLGVDFEERGNWSAPTTPANNPAAKIITKVQSEDRTPDSKTSCHCQESCQHHHSGG